MKDRTAFRKKQKESCERHKKKKAYVAPVDAAPTPATSVTTGDGRVLACRPGLVVTKVPPVPRYVATDQTEMSFHVAVHGEKWT